MSVAATTAPVDTAPVKPKLDGTMSPGTVYLFLAILAVGLLFTAYNIYQDVQLSGTQTTTIAPFLSCGGIDRCPWV
jgi:PiT family inorganic phosphate transporter